MRPPRLVFFLTALLAMALGIAPASHAQTLKIGIVGPMTGPAAPWGIALAEGAKILAARYNAEGGLDVGGTKHPVEMIIYDDFYSTPGAVAAYNRLVYEDGVKYMVVIAGISTMAVKQKAADDKVVVMTAGYIAEELDPNSHYMYRMWGPPADFFPPLIKWLHDNRPERRVVILNPNDETSRQNADLAEKLYKQGGYEVLANQLYERSLKDFLPLLTKVLALKPDMLDLGATAPQTAAVLVRQARDFGFKGLIVDSGSTAWNEIIQGAGAKDAEGVINVFGADPANENYRKFAEQYRKAIGQEPNDVLAPYSDGIDFLLQSIAASGSITDTSKFEAGFFKAAPFTTIQGEKVGITGEKEYGINHQVAETRYVGVIKNGKIVVLGKIH
jgi:branched-chain amino acid transport system substrate-binding protein